MPDLASPAKGQYRFVFSELSRNFHVPLICSPWAYSTPRGS